MPSGFERRVLLFHLQPVTVPKGADIPKLEEIAKILHVMWKKGEAITRLEELEAEDVDQAELTLAKKRPNNAVYIQDMRLHADSCDILLTLGDAAESDPAIVNLSDRTMTHVSKGANGGVGFSAHLTLHFKGSPKPIQYRAALERMPNLGRNIVINYINRLLRKFSQDNAAFRFVEVGTGRDLAWRPKLLSAAQPSRAMSTALKAGRLSDVVLVQRKRADGEIDSSAGFKVKEKRLKLSLEDVPANEDGRRKWLNGLTNWARKHDYDEVQVRIKPFTGGKDMSSKFSTELADAAEAIFSRHEQIDLSHETGQCHEKLLKRIYEPLGTMVSNDKLWK